MKQINTKNIYNDILYITVRCNLTGEQIRAARSMLGLSAQALAEAAGVSVPTMQRLDSTKGQLSGRYETVLKVKSALEARGIQFLDTGQVASGSGVSLKSD